MINRFKDDYRPLSNFWILSRPIFLPDIIGPADGYQYMAVENAYQAAKSLNMTERWGQEKLKIKVIWL